MAEKQNNNFYIVELASIIAFLGLALLLIQKVIVGLATVYGQTGWPTIIMAIVALTAGYIGSDFVSGMVHFLCDTFGSENTPVLGQGFIKAFRVHHSDPTDITRHGFVETNGKNCLISLPVFIFAVLFLNFGDFFQLFVGIFITALTLAVFGTNQFHKWAHTAELKGFPVVLQKWGVILSKENHNVHHTAPHDKYYCITTGWLNPLLTKIKFFDIIKLIFKKNEYGK